MRVAVSGTHGAGKTTLLEAVLKQRPKWHTVAEATRLLVPELGYSSPYEIVESNGIAMYEAMIIASWNFLSSSSSTALPTSDVILLCDRSPIDNLAYYHILRKPEEFHHEDLLTRLAKFFIQQIQVHVFVPLLPFAVELDRIQPVETQRQVQDAILRLYTELGITHKTLTTTSIEDRAKELIDLIEKEQAEHL